jgi:tryptophan-rich sensory protein
VAGFAIGPHGFRWVTRPESIETISGIGLALLLFMIGLEIDLKKMLSAGRVITITAGAQILGCVLHRLAGFRLVRPSAKPWLEAFYLGVAAAMSSTVIIVKILYDKRELETLAGRVTLGVLVLQDIATILFLAVQPNLKNPAAGVMTLALWHVILLLLAVAFLASRFLLPPVFKFVARLPELVLVGALAWCFAMAGFADYLKLSSRHGRAHRRRDDFHVSLHARCGRQGHQPPRFFCDAVFRRPRHVDSHADGGITSCGPCFVPVLIGSRLVTVFPRFILMKQGYRVSLLPAINLCQMSELSLVLLALGKKSGDVSDNVIGIAAFAFSFLAIGSTYAILANDTCSAKPRRCSAKWVCTTSTTRRSLTTGRRLAPPHLPAGVLLDGEFVAGRDERNRPTCCTELCVIDFNPVVHEKLNRARSIPSMATSRARRA